MLNRFYVHCAAGFPSQLSEVLLRTRYVIWVVKSRVLRQVCCCVTLIFLFASHRNLYSVDFFLEWNGSQMNRVCSKCFSYLKTPSRQTQRLKELCKKYPLSVFDNRSRRQKVTFKSQNSWCISGWLICALRVSKLKANILAAKRKNQKMSWLWGLTLKNGNVKLLCPRLMMHDLFYWAHQSSLH